MDPAGSHTDGSRSAITDKSQFSKIPNEILNHIFHHVSHDWCTHEHYENLDWDDDGLSPAGQQKAALRDTHALTLVSRRFNAWSIPYLYRRLDVHLEQTQSSLDAIHPEKLDCLHRSLLEKPELRSICKRLALRAYYEGRSVDSDNEHTFSDDLYSLVTRDYALNIISWSTGVEHLVVDGNEWHSEAAIAEVGPAIQAMPRLRILDLGMLTDSEFLHFLEISPECFQRITSLRIHLDDSKMCPLVQKLKSLSRTASSKELDAELISDIDLTEAMIQFSQGLECLTIRQYMFSTTQGTIQQLESALRYHSATLKHIDLRSCLRESRTPEFLLSGMNLSSFTELERFSAPLEITGCNLNSATNHLAPNLREFTWVLGSWVVDKVAESQSILPKWMGLLMDESLKRSTRIKFKIIIKTSFRCDGSWANGLFNSLIETFQSRGIDVSLERAL